jgi:sirohydrochlorin ferrochelatase
MTDVVAFGRGSRNAATNEEVGRFVARYRAHRHDLLVYHGYIELAEPLLSAACQDVARKSQRVVVLPMLLSRAGHVKNEIPLALAAARKQAPEVQFAAAPPWTVLRRRWFETHNFSLSDVEVLVKRQLPFERLERRSGRGVQVPRCPAAVKGTKAHRREAKQPLGEILGRRASRRP